MKINRHSKILELINATPVTTQEELLALLRRDGYDVTQSTVSRDIKQLRLLKVATPDGTYRYVQAENANSGAKDGFERIISTSVTTVDYAQNIVVIKTYSGMAQAVCAALDSMEFDNALGTLAGDDTLIMICRTTENAQKCVKDIKKYC